MVPVSRFARCENKGWEADERPEPRSLGLLPSGPDPVGEWLVHRQPPGDYIGRGGGESKRRSFGGFARALECAQAAKTGPFGWSSMTPLSPTTMPKTAWWR